MRDVGGGMESVYLLYMFRSLLIGR